MIAALAGGESSRVVSSLLALTILSIASYVLSALILRSKRTVALHTDVRLQAQPTR